MTLNLETQIAAVEKKVGVLLDPLHLVMAGVLLITLLFGVYLFESRRAEVAEAKATIAAETLKVAQQEAASEKVQNALQQAQDKAVEEAMAVANEQLQAANMQLATANKQLSDKLLQQQNIDKNLPPTAQAQRWEQLVPSAQVVVTPTGFAIDAVGGLATLQDLEELPIDREKINNLNQQLQNDQTNISNDEKALNAEKDAHASDLKNDQAKLDTANKATEKVQADFKAYKAKSRKNLIKWIFGSLGVGIGIGLHF